MNMFKHVYQRLSSLPQDVGDMDVDTREFPWADQWPEITDVRVRQAFANVSRAAFLPPDLRRWADRDAPLPLKMEQTISQPFVVALMTQALAPQTGDRILEIGTGSGFQTALLCALTTPEDATPGASVFSMERHGALLADARQALTANGYHPHLRLGDGAGGWPEEAPFQGIIVTAAPAYLPRPLWEQLAEGGRLVIPIGPAPDAQTLWCVSKIAGALHARSLGPVRFVPLISALLDDPAQRIDLARR